ncbi:arginine/agmatine antiporter [Desulfosporosinus acididurans]|uniref:Arginine/agmatine antiporter n=1 Tax=Desulfosporosinus acididurans TaxID=476652 RepID=A0A0J1FLP9_9FIRM|nr:APC family permease [Desulfosporosinus acididurans]KLU64395.1 arginine/agmatine antiporter [Desulfosporosinus acididurans]
MSKKEQTPVSSERTIDWKQGLAIAMGVPLLILPSIGYFTKYVLGFSIIVWVLSIFQGFMQNTAYGEMASVFPQASGLPGFSQEAFKGTTIGKYDIGKLVGGFSAWGYWFSWNSVLAVYAMLIGQYLHNLLPAFANVDTTVLSILSGLVVFSLLILVCYRGLASGAILGYILSIVSIVPLVVLSAAPMLNGKFHLSNITQNMLPAAWSWSSGRDLLIFVGIMAMAEWSACGWETAAIYGPEYKNPKTDIPKSLFSCGIICAFIYVFVQAACIGALGTNAVINEPNSPMLLLAQQSFGSVGATIAVFMLIASMILIIQTAFFGSARAMESMAKEENLPAIFGKTNMYGTPVIAMVVTALFNMALITLKSPAAVLAASAIGYICANGISLFAYVKVYSDKKLRSLHREFKAPSGWKIIALICALVNIPLYLVGITYLNALDSGWSSTLVGVGVLLLYIPLWFYTQHLVSKNQQYHAGKSKAA